MVSAPRRALLLLALQAAACTEDQYVIGAVCPALGSCPPDGGSAGTSGSGGSSGSGGAAAGTSGGGSTEVGPLQVDLLGSGVERLPEALFGVDPTHWLIADDARADVWQARVGENFQVIAPNALRLGELSPFADPGSVLSHAGAVTFSAESNWADTGAGAIALEAVFRGEQGATLLSQRAGVTGLELVLDAEGRLTLQLAAEGSTLSVSSQALVKDAWHHCLALFDSAQAAAQIFCNGQAGAAVTVPNGFAIAELTSAAVLGSADMARVHWAELGRWQAPTWGPRGAWGDQANARFARLVGTFAEGSSAPLPLSEVRASGAYVDMSPSDRPELRRLHPVGEHWPRVVCRPTAESPRECGLLVEPDSSRSVSSEDFRLDHWTATEVTTTLGSSAGPTGADTLLGLQPSDLDTEHTLERLGPVGDGPAVFSLYARAGSRKRVSLEVVGAASATFDVADSLVLDSSDALASDAEAWGDGLVRLSLAYESAGGPQMLRILLLDDDSSPTFAGDGSAVLDLGDAELRFGSVATLLPTFGDIQRADHLAYKAGNGNFPPGPWFELAAEVWLPRAPLAADAAVLNVNFASRYDQQINLFVNAIGGTAQFGGLQGDRAPWTVASEVPITDGAWHRLGAGVGSNEATLRVDDDTTRGPAAAFDVGVLDRIDVGKTTSSSGALTGLVRRVAISAVP
jgi:hypothetical protein